MDKLRVLGVGAHPDDLEILCGGTLAKYVKLGHKVIMAHLLNGDKGHYEMDSKKLARVRREEAENAAQIIGAEVLSLDFPDGELFSNLEIRKKVINLIRQAKPDVIITHTPKDYMSDHIVTSQLVCDASFLSTASLFKTGQEVHGRITPIFFMDTMAGVNFLPSEYVDISDTFEKKKEMIKQHKSQLDWLKRHNSIDILEFAETVSRFRGLQCGVKYAEGFSQYEAWGRKVPMRLLP